MKGHLPPLEEAIGTCTACSKEELLMPIGKDEAFICESCMAKIPGAGDRLHAINKGLLSQLDEGITTGENLLKMEQGLVSLMKMAGLPIPDEREATRKRMKENVAQMKELRKNLLEVMG